MITSDNGAPATAVPDWAADWLVLSARSVSDVDVDTAHTGRSAKWEAWKKDGLVFSLGNKFIKSISEGCTNTDGRDIN